MFDLKLTGSLDLTMHAKVVVTIARALMPTSGINFAGASIEARVRVARTWSF